MKTHQIKYDIEYLGNLGNKTVLKDQNAFRLDAIVYIELGFYNKRKR